VVTRRSHPPTLLTLVRRTLREEVRVERGDHLLVAVSGGGDSIALLHALARLAPKLGLRLSAHGVDHGLREEAALELDLAESLAARLGVEFSRSQVELGDRGNLQARARAARYAALRAAKAAAGARYVATAHHADDRAETVLMRLLRGAGPRGLAVLPPRAADLIRPMIRVRKPAVLAHLERHCLAYASDPSNGDSRFLRTRVRGELLPLLESMEPAVVEHLNALADGLAAGPPPAVLDAQGTPVQLGRAQVSALRRAAAHNLRGAQVSVAGGRTITIDAKTGSYAVHEATCETRKSGLLER
jgi:tRNA(Ile)-lysidine synthase